ncbi:hypothetical protein ACLMJK_008199 [Lecanora helva]
MATTTTMMEMQPRSPQQAALRSPKDQIIPLQEEPRSNQTDITRPGDVFSGTGHVVLKKERWNNPKINTWRLAAIYYAFIVFGANDASYGALVPYIEEDYGLSYLVTSLVFLSPFAGYTFSALFSDRLHRLSGRRGIAIIGPASKLIAYIVISCHPPYPAVVVILALVGIGNGLLDAAWNAWIGTMDHPNQLLGLLHGCYGLGATLSPIIATSMVTRGHLNWWTFYYLMAGLVALEMIVVTSVFWSETGLKYRDTNRADGEEKGMTRRALRNKVTWICSALFLTYVGTEVSLGGWIVTFMLRVRHARPFPSGMTATGFWLGLTVGRIILGFITPKIGEGPAISVYIVFAVGLQLIFWLVPQFFVSAIAIALVGFFIGPIFPSGVVAATKLLPTELHVAAIGFSAAFGGGGAAVLPFAVGAIAQARGVQTLQPIVVALLAGLLGIWLCLPKIPKHLHEN